MMEISPSEWRLLKESNDPVYNAVAATKFSSLTTTTLTTYINAVVRMDSPVSFALFKFLYNLREMLNHDSTGKYLTADQTLQYALRTIAPASVGNPAETAEAALYAHHFISPVSFTSNAAGNLDADATLLAALSGYYGVVRLGKIWGSQNVAAGGALVIKNGADVAIATLVLTAIVANTPNDCLDGIQIFPSAYTDNSKIYLDTTCANLGNATTFRLETEYHYET